MPDLSSALSSRPACRLANARKCLAGDGNDGVPSDLAQAASAACRTLRPIPLSEVPPSRKAPRSQSFQLLEQHSDRRYLASGFGQGCNVLSSHTAPEKDNH
jgi:hypothetical protein